MEFLLPDPRKGETRAPKKAFQRSNASLAPISGHFDWLSCRPGEYVDKREKMGRAMICLHFVATRGSEVQKSSKAMEPRTTIRHF
jgi:hypothetical protein